MQKDYFILFKFPSGDTMFPIILLLGVSAIRVSALECFYPLVGSMRCEAPTIREPTLKLTKTGLLTCMDKCVGAGHGCAHLKWNQKKKVCYIFKDNFKADIRGQCIGFLRFCPIDTDVLEMERLSSNPSRRVAFTYQRGTSMECRILCSYWFTCWGVTWNSPGGSCMLHSKHKLNVTRKSIDGSEYFMKNNRKKARCLSVKTHASTPGGAAEVAESLPECLNHLTSRDDFMAADWIEAWHHCEIFTSYIKFRYTGEYVWNLHFIMMQNCEAHINVCSQQEDDSVMYGGHPIGFMPRQDCFSICKLVRTCVAATSISKENKNGLCYFHGMLRQVYNIQGSSTIKIVQCNDSLVSEPFLESVYSKKISATLKQTQGYRQSNSSMFKQCALYTGDSWLHTLYKHVIKS